MCPITLNITKKKTIFSHDKIKKKNFRIFFYKFFCSFIQNSSRDLSRSFSLKFSRNFSQVKIQMFSQLCFQSYFQDFSGLLGILFLGFLSKSFSLSLYTRFFLYASLVSRWIASKDPNFLNSYWFSGMISTEVLQEFSSEEISGIPFRESFSRDFSRSSSRDFY